MTMHCPTLETWKLAGEWRGPDAPARTAVNYPALPGTNGRLPAAPSPVPRTFTAVLNTAIALPAATPPTATLALSAAPIVFPPPPVRDENGGVSGQAFDAWTVAIKTMIAQLFDLALSENTALRQQITAATALVAPAATPAAAAARSAAAAAAPKSSRGAQRGRGNALVASPRKQDKKKGDGHQDSGWVDVASRIRSARRRRRRSRKPFVESTVHSAGQSAAAVPAKGGAPPVLPYAYPAQAAVPPVPVRVPTAPVGRPKTSARALVATRMDALAVTAAANEHDGGNDMKNDENDDGWGEKKSVANAAAWGGESPGRTL